jgi:hypothetical protein
MTEIELEQINHDGEIFYRIDPETVDLSKMDQAQKLTDIFAFQVPDGHEQDVITESCGIDETINHANAGDWIVFNIGNSAGESLQEKLSDADMKVIREEDFPKLYKEKTDINEDDSNYGDYDRIFQGAAFQNVAIYHYIGKPVFVARVPFNFAIRAPWGRDQFIRAGGFMVYNPNTSHQGHHDIYGTQGAHHRKAGQFEKTYSKIGEDTDPMEKIDTIEEVYKNVIKADRSPISGIQFNMSDLARAYERIGRELTHDMDKYRE